MNPDMTRGPDVAPIIACDIVAGARRMHDADNARVFQELKRLEDEAASASVRREGFDVSVPCVPSSHDAGNGHSVPEW